MTTILVDIKKGKVYSDKRRTSTQHYSDSWGFLQSETVTQTYYDEVEKIKRLPDGRLFIGCGSVELIEKAFDQLHRGVPMSDPAGTQTTIAILQRKGDLVQIDQYDARTKSCVWKEKTKWVLSTNILSDGCVTFGSGGDFAKGAFSVSKDGVVAIKAAIECDIYSGGSIIEVNIDERDDDL